VVASRFKGPSPLRLVPIQIEPSLPATPTPPLDALTATELAAVLAALAPAAGRR
jgi:hypothetical protein